MFLGVEPEQGIGMWLRLGDELAHLWNNAFTWQGGVGENLLYGKVVFSHLGGILLTLHLYRSGCKL